MPKNTNILMVRHAEKPDSGPGLAVAGQERAQAYVIYFQNYVLNSSPLKINSIFATADSPKSMRPRLTVQPFAEAMGLPIHDQVQDQDFQTVADEILQNPQYDNSTLLICWHHGEILALAAALGVNASQLPPASHWPSQPWPEDVYGWLLQLCYDATGAIIPAQTLCINQQLMFDDYGNNPPQA
jgi:hypothetical protein